MINGVIPVAVQSTDVLNPNQSTDVDERVVPVWATSPVSDL